MDLYHAITILFPVSLTVMTPNVQCANMAPHYYFVQPQFGYMSWNGVNSRWPHRDKGLVHIVQSVSIYRPKFGLVGMSQ